MTKKFKVGLDDGHGMETAGKRTPALKEALTFRGKTFKKGSIIHENDFNENLMELVEKGLDRCGIGHTQLAPGDTDVTLANRVKSANAQDLDLVVSLHANALTGEWQTKAYGLVVIHHEKCQAKTKELAKNCYNHLSKEVSWYSNGGTKYGVKADTDISGYSLYILKNTKAPAILIEYGFMDNWEDVKVMVTPKFQQDCAEATVKGICETLGVKYVAPSTASTSTNKPTASNIGKNKYANGSYGKKAKVVVPEGDVLNVRASRSATAKLVGSFKNGQIIEVNYCLNNWFSTWSLGKEGYINGAYVELI